MAAPLSRLAAQAVHITTDPIPRSLTESKQVLAALQKFGEVVTFRNLWYDAKNSSPAHARHTVAIFETRDAASRAIAASPLTIPLPPAKANLNKTTTTNIPTSNPPFSTPEQSRTRFLNCRIQKSHHNHESAVKRNPYHSYFEVDRDTTQYRDLVNSTQIPLRDLAGGFLDKKQGKKRISVENERWGATSLWGMYEQGLKAEEKVENGSNDGSSSSGKGERRSATKGG
ncbi:uncharacterized protein ACHE_11665A [Aspergillus chevalieri]|uniref:RRM domain-containing protein n=1 Tax=Aspergillus chevalieri TaxID=182096 RepID=A0A7R7VI35_ASPCH|nr:uncharacterized protein ACHE_11665A [Aspergillus chevalieri]BCR84263.1 hypothetical protein ACHE_11665A [Aspergillus chevalieri]